ncbi:MAG: type IV pilus modification protein PilV [Gammaproteobacteria bacterium]
MPKFNLRDTLGFTLIEVLVSMVILAIGLLGLASLQGISLKNNQDAYLFSQANALAYEMSDRIKANKLGWTSIPAAPAAACATGCTQEAPCTPANMAASDYCYWLQKATNTLSSDATVDIQTSSGTTPCTGGASSLCLTMTWPRSNNKNLSNTTNYQLEVTP